jgi:hypothetical protein
MIYWPLPEPGRATQESGLFEKLGTVPRLRNRRPAELRLRKDARSGTGYDCRK